MTDPSRDPPRDPLPEDGSVPSLLGLLDWPSRTLRPRPAWQADLATALAALLIIAAFGFGLWWYLTNVAIHPPVGIPASPFSVASPVP